MDIYKRVFVVTVIITLALIFRSSLNMNKIESFYPEGFGGRSEDIAIRAPSTLDPKVTEIAFLKAAKTGSSTMASIIVRFCLRNNLTTYISKLRYLNITMQNAVLAEGRHYDCFTTHTLYSYYFFTHIVKNPAIIGLLRHPEERLISHAFYFLRKDHRFDGLSNEAFLDEIISNTVKYRCNNIMSKKLQIYDRAKRDKESLSIELAKLKSEFMLVLILERFDESLVLMKRLLNWSFIDIVYTRRNEYKTPKSFLNNTQKEKVRQSEDLDFKVYNYFLSELEKNIRDAGQDFYAEVYQFRQVLRQVNMFCASKDEVRTYQIPKSKWESTIYLFKQDCDSFFEYGNAWLREKIVS